MWCPYLVAMASMEELGQLVATLQAMIEEQVEESKLMKAETEVVKKELADLKLENVDKEIAINFKIEAGEHRE